MRLIDADNFLERFEKMCKTELDNVIAIILKGTLINEPTAYDIDKVIEELEKEAERWEDSGKEYKDKCEIAVGRGLRNSIEIIKAGGNING